MKRTSFYTIILSSLLIFSAACNQPKKGDNSTATEESTEMPAAQDERVLEYHDKLLSSFSPDWMERESDPELYPDYYGGSYINNDGKFVIAITGNAAQRQQELAKVLGSDDFKLETVQYSYRQMLQVMDRIDAFLGSSSVSEDHPVLKNFAGAYPDVMDNRVKVTLVSVDAAVTNAFKKDISNSPLVVFEKGDRPELM